MIAQQGAIGRMSLVNHTRRGRKRKHAARKPCGRLSQLAEAALQASTMAVVLEQPHRRWLAEDMRDSRKAEHELGRLRLAKRITSGQYAAGMEFGWLALRMLRAIECPPREPTNSIAAHIASDPSDIIDDSPLRPKLGEQEAYDVAMADYRGARAVIINAFKLFRGDVKGETHGRMVLAELHNVCVHDRQAGSFTELTHGLNILEQHWRRA